MKKKIVGLFAVLAVSSVMAQQIPVEYAVYDGKSSDSFVTAGRTSGTFALGRGTESFVLVVNRITSNAVIVAWGKNNPGSVENMTVTFETHPISGKLSTRAIASRDVVSMTVGNDAVLLGTLSSSTPVVDGVEDKANRKASISLKGSQIDGTFRNESFGALALKYNLKVSTDINRGIGEDAINAYVSRQSKGAVTSVTLP